VQVSALRVGVFWLRRLFGGSEVQWHSSGYVDLANFGSESETCVGSRVRLVGVSISFKKNFLSALIHSPPLCFAVSVLQREEGSLDYDGGFVRLQIHVKFDRIINHQQRRRKCHHDQRCHA
jgi:hypothetical protein